MVEERYPTDLGIERQRQKLKKRLMPGPSHERYKPGMLAAESIARKAAEAERRRERAAILRAVTSDPPSMAGIATTNSELAEGLSALGLDEIAGAADGSEEMGR